jgi:hypothetical protein
MNADDVWAILENPNCQTFFWGFVGSAAVELSTVLNCYRRGRFPKRFSRKGFWFARTGLAAAAGLIAIANGNHNALIAIGVGAATPLILANMTQRDTTSEFKQLE